MKKLFFLAILAELISACATTPTSPMSSEERLDHAQAVATDWCTYSEAAAMRLIKEFGPPDKIEPNRLTWRDKGPWKKISIWDNAQCSAMIGFKTLDYDHSPTVGPDIMEQTLFYTVPRDKRKELAEFSDKLAVSRDGKKLSVRGNSEALDFLALNLADQIVRGSRSPEDARSFYGRICQLSQAGKSSPYTQGLLFVH
jgi:hypothetical protein